MDFEAHSNRGRLNLLVQLFENQSKAEETSSTSPNGCRTLHHSKLSLSLRERVSQETSEPFMDAPICSVDQLIKTFNARRHAEESDCPHRKCQGGSNETSQWRCSPRGFPEVHAMIEEIFDRIEQLHQRSASLKSCCSLDPDVELSLTIPTGMMPCTPPSKTQVETPGRDGEIGAIWTQDSLTSMESGPDDSGCGTDVDRFCSEKLSQYTDFFGSCLASSDGFSPRGTSPRVGGGALKETIKQVMTQMQQEVTNKDVPVGVSVKACRALIEMMVSVEEIPSPTVNIANRPPCPVATDDADLIFSTDDLALHAH